MKTSNLNSSSSLMQELVTKSWESPQFKNQLIKNPLRTIENVLGNKPDTSKFKKIIVEDQTDQSIIYLNIPSEPNLNEIELTEAQLEMVAGGVIPVAVVIVTLVGAGFGATWGLDKLF